MQTGLDNNCEYANRIFIAYCIRKWLLPTQIRRTSSIFGVLRELIKLADEYYVIHYKTLGELNVAIKALHNFETLNRYLRRLKAHKVIDWERAYRGYDGVITLSFCQTVIHWHPNWFAEQMAYERDWLIQLEERRGKEHF